MPFLDERKPPVTQATLDAARMDLPREYGYLRVTEGDGATLLVRVPRAKPDYNYELAVAALYVSMDDVKDLKHVLLVGDESTVRMDPIRLRDHVRDQLNEDAELVKRARRGLEREYGRSIVNSEINVNHHALAIRLPIGSLANATDDLVMQAWQTMGREFTTLIRQVTHVYLISDADHGRLGRRAFVEGIDPTLVDVLAQEHGASANPIHLKYQSAGGLIR